MNQDIFNSKHSNSNPLSLNNLLFYFFFSTSVWGVLAQLHILLGLSFTSLFSAYLVFLILQFSIIIFLIINHRLEIKHAIFSKTSICLLILSLIGLFLACGWIRPDPDDFNYIGGRAVYWAANPNQPLDLVYHNFALTPFTMSSKLLFFKTINLMNAFFALLFNVQVIDIFHIFFPAVGGVLIPLVWYMAIHRFVDSEAGAIFGTILIIAFLCLDGTEHRSFGNFGFVRIWQGKAILMSIFIPLFIAWSIDILNKPSVMNRIRLIVLGISSTALSPGCLPMVPFLTLMMVSGHIFSNGFKKDALIKLSHYILTQFWILFSGIITVFWIDKSKINQYGFNAGFPDNFWEQYALVFGTKWSFAIIAVLLSLFITFLLTDRKHRYFLFGWILFGIITIYNPWSMPIISKYFTSYNIYWRMFYLLPFPLAIGLAGGLIIQRYNFNFKSVVIAGALLIPIVSIYTTIHPDSTVYGHLLFQPFQHKVNPVVKKNVKYIIQHTPSGPLLAPLVYRVHLSLYDSERLHLVGRALISQQLGIINNETDLVQSRINAANFTECKSENLTDFTTTLSQGVRSVIMANCRRKKGIIDRIMNEHGFSMTGQTRYFKIYVKHPEYASAQ